MSSLREMGFSYMMLVIDAVTAFSKRTEHLPLIIPLGTMFLAFYAVDFFLPRWAAVSIYAATGLPVAAYLIILLYVFFTHHDFRGRPRRL